MKKLPDWGTQSAARDGRETDNSHWMSWAVSLLFSTTIYIYLEKEPSKYILIQIATYY